MFLYMMLWVVIYSIINHFNISLMKTIVLFSLVIFVGLFLFLLMANTSIQFNPFKITIQKPLNAIGYFLVLTGIALITYESKKIARHEGYIQGMEDLTDSLKTEIREGRFIP
jgi:hypothetical protein